MNEPASKQQDTDYPHSQLENLILMQAIRKIEFSFPSTVLCILTGSTIRNWYNVKTWDLNLPKKTNVQWVPEWWKFLPDQPFETFLTSHSLNSLHQKRYHILVKNWIFDDPFHKKDQYCLFWCQWWSDHQDQEVFWWNWALEAVEASEVAEAAEVNEAGEVSKA